MTIHRPPRPPSRRRLVAFAAGCVLPGLLSLSLPDGVGAQETEGPIVPGGRLRIELAPSFTSWDTRFGPDGKEPLATDLTYASAARLIPGVPDLEAELRALLEDPSWQAELGSTAASVTAEQTRLPLRLDVGVTDWLTVGVMVPFVKNRTELTFLYQGDSARLGVNPAVSDQSAVLTFFDALHEAESAASARAAEACGADPSSPACAEAQGAHQGVAAFMAGLEDAYAASPLFPTGTSAAGEGLSQRLAGVSAALEAAGVAPIDLDVPLAATALTDVEALNALLQEPGASFLLPSLQDRVGLWELGDVELQAAIRLLNGSVRDSAGAPARARWQVGAGALVRLGTGSTDDPNVPFHRGSGDGQTDVEGRLFANLTVGRFGLWADGRYGVQLGTTTVRRIGPPDVVLVPQGNLAQVEWTPGSYMSLELAPRYHLTESLAFALGYRLFLRGEDEYTVEAPPEDTDLGPIPGGKAYTDVTLLAQETEQTLHQVGGGIVFSTLEMWREGRAPLPLEARFTIRGSVAGSGGRTPSYFRTEVGLRVFQRLWGK